MSFFPLPLPSFTILGKILNLSVAGFPSGSGAPNSTHLSPQPDIKDSSLSSSPRLLSPMKQAAVLRYGGPTGRNWGGTPHTAKEELKPSVQQLIRNQILPTATE